MYRNTVETFSDILVLKVKAKTKIYEGNIVALENGFATSPTKKENLVVVGRAETFADNTGGKDGDVFVNVKRGVFLYENDTDNPLDDTHILKDCYIKDSITVSAQSTGTSPAGKVIGFEKGQVIVDFTI